MPFLSDNGCHVVPEAAEEAARFIAETGKPRKKEFRGEQLDMLRTRAQLMAPELLDIRQRLSLGQYIIHAKFRSLPRLSFWMHKGRAEELGADSS